MVAVSSRRQQNAVAGDEPAGLVEPAVHGDEIACRQAIAIEEDADLAGAGGNAAVADLAAAEAPVLVANMLERQRQAHAPAFDNARGIWPRTIVGNDDFEIAVRLLGERAQHRVERIFAIISRDDDGNQRRAVHGLSLARSAATVLGPRHCRNRSRSRRLRSRNMRIGSAK